MAPQRARWRVEPTETVSPTTVTVARLVLAPLPHALPPLSGATDKENPPAPSLAHARPDLRRSLIHVMKEACCPKV